MRGLCISGQLLSQMSNLEMDVERTWLDGSATPLMYQGTVPLEVLYFKSICP